jgi:hypothetical protein
MIPRLVLPTREHELQQEVLQYTPRNILTPRTPRPSQHSSTEQTPPTVEECLELIEYQQDLLQEYAYDILKLNILLLRHQKKLEEILARLGTARELHSE